MINFKDFFPQVEIPKNRIYFFQSKKIPRKIVRVDHPIPEKINFFARDENK